MRLAESVAAPSLAPVLSPAGWSGNRPPRPQVRAIVGGTQPSGLATKALLDFQVDVALDGESLTEAEIAALLAATDGLALVRGRWVEVDKERLQGMLERFREAEQAAEDGGLPFGQAMRLLAGADVAGSGATEADPGWTRVVPGPWLAEVLGGLRGPEGLGRVDPGPGFRGMLRPYQQVGLGWLHLLSTLGLGACLADDMGLGKTVQVLALLLALRDRDGARRRPSLLVAPASLLANWAREAERFAPDLRVTIAHPSARPAAELKTIDAKRCADADLVLTSYGSLLRLPALANAPWRLAILDEAQAIKNPDAKQTRAAKAIPADARLALTGTPVENRLADLWSIFDFLQPGLLGSAREFTAFAKRLAKREHNAYAPLRELVRPYLLRRLETDRSVIDDLPEKTEMTAFCGLARKQAALYAQAVDDLAERLGEIGGMQRRGTVLSFLMRFKQICNHPSQWLGDGAWAEADSGKLARLREIAETIAARQEKALVFTQFREAAEPLAAFLAGVFGRPGLVLHGGVPVAERRRKAARAMEKLAKKGQPVSPVAIEGRKIALTFWGKAWCENLERYGDYANRLPRGRTYVRNGSVVDLQVEAGAVRARQGRKEKGAGAADASPRGGKSMGRKRAARVPAVAESVGEVAALPRVVRRRGRA